MERNHYSYLLSISRAVKMVRCSRKRSRAKLRKCSQKSAGNTECQITRCYVLAFYMIATLSSIQFYAETTEWVRNKILDFNEDDILCESKVKLKDGSYKTFKVQDIDMTWLEWLESHQSFHECQEVLDKMFDYMSRFKVLPVCMRLVSDEHVQHAYRMKRWYVDAR